MALSWLTILRTVPWSEVISNAPMIADGAKKLWKTASGKPATPEPDPADFAPKSDFDGANAIKELKSRLAVLGASTADLQVQMLASSRLLKDLAHQNALLIERIESNRRWVLFLSAATVILFIAVVTLLWS
jgi:hypothetical protein